MLNKAHQALTKDKVKLYSDIIFSMNKLILIFLLVFFSMAQAKELQKVSLQFQWLDQFQFAGYYMAKEKGFYQDAHLEVEFKKFNFKTNVADDVLAEKTNYGIGRSSLIIENSKKRNIKLLSAIFQSSPLVLIATKDSNITRIKDFVGKKIMTTADAYLSVSLHAMANHEHIDSTQMIEQQHSFNVQDLINNKTDLMASYISNEPFLLQKAGVEYTIFNPKDYGFDFYSDILFTSDTEAKNYPYRTQKFKDASLKGWKYAFENIEETVQLILKKYNTQNKSKEALLFEAKELKKLAYYKTKKLGDINPNKIQRIYDIYNVMGFVHNPIDINNFILKDIKNSDISFTQEEKLYLKNKKELKVCIDPRWMPFEGFEGTKHVGLSAEYLQLFQKHLDIPLRVIPTQSWSQTLQKAKQRECDIISLVTKTQKREEYLNFTKPLIKSNIVLATKLGNNFIVDFTSLKSKTIATTQDYSIYKTLKTKYPYLDIIEVENIKVGLTKVRDGEIYGYIGSLASVGYLIQKEFMGQIHISGKFNESLDIPLGIRNDEIYLSSIFNKLVNSISKEQHKTILDKWVNIDIQVKPEYTFLYQILALALFLILIFVYKTIVSEKYAKELEKEKKKFLETQNNFNLGQKISNLGIWTLDYKTEKLEWTDGIHFIFETNHNTFGASYEAFMEFVHPDDRKLLEETYRASVKNKTDYFLEHRIITTSGETKYVEERCQNIFDTNGHILKSVGTVLDTTARKKVEQKLEELNSTLEQRVKSEIEKNEFKEKQLFQQSRLAQMGEMISMIAHQWRQPLSAISATSNNLKIKLELDVLDFETKEGIDETKEYFLEKLENINYYVQNLSTTINDFRDFYKPNKLPKFKSLQTVVKKSLDLTASSIIGENINIIENFNSDLEIEIYDSELMQVILNIIKNAQDNFKEKKTKNPTMVITVHNTKISICDNGGGIPENIIGNIFDPYFSTKDEKNGTGIGLYMSKMIVENHHFGKLLAQNTKDGVCFIIELREELNNKQIQQ